MKDFDRLTRDEFDYLKKYLLNKTGIVISDNREVFFETRLYRFLSKHQIKTWSELISLLKQNKAVEIIEEFIPYLTTNKTHFFREIDHFKYLDNEFLPEIEEKKDIYAWCAASSTGEEVYTISVVLNEYFSKKSNKPNIYVLGSDIDYSVLNIAKRGVYSHIKIDKELDVYNLKNYLLKGSGVNSGHYKFVDQIQKNTKFMEVNLIDNSTFPKMKFDIIFLRNVLIYFDTQTVKKVVQNVSHCLNDQGVLILGLSEGLKMDIPHLEYLGKSIYRMRSRVKIKNSSSNESKHKTLRSINNKTVLIVDDSKSMQKILKKVIEENSDMKVVGLADNAKHASELIEQLKPDVLTLDMKMPDIDGIEFLEKILPQIQHDMGVVVVSSYNKDDFNFCLRALELGAFEYLEKPAFKNMKNMAPHLISCLKNAPKFREILKIKKKITRNKSRTSFHNENDLIVIGASTGGVVAIKDLLTQFPNHIPPVVIVQHIPGLFSKKFADRLNDLYEFSVVEASDNQEILPNTVYIAPGGKQLKMKCINGRYKVQITDDPPVNRHRPSVDYFFNSLSECIHQDTKVYAIILTGMGRDGASGLLSLKKKGCFTIAQDEESSVVFGMPRAAIELEAANYIESLEDIPSRIFDLIKKKAA